MAYSEKIIEKIKDVNFTWLCRCEFYFAAIAVQNESTATPNHENRILLTNKILTNKLDPEIMSMSVMTNATLQGKIEADNDTYYGEIAYIVTTVFDSIANSQASLNS